MLELGELKAVGSESSSDVRAEPCSSVSWEKRGWGCSGLGVTCFVITHKNP